MFKKILLIIVISFLFIINIVSAATPTLLEASKASNKIKENSSKIEQLKKWAPTVKNAKKIEELQWEIVKEQWIVNDFKDYTNKESMTSKYFSINTNTFSPVAHHSGDTKQVVNFVLWTIIQKLMIAIWVISLLVMTIWAWYMIFYHWQDELLSKGKSIFNSWIIALIVALSSYYIVSLVRLILYSNS